MIKESYQFLYVLMYDAQIVVPVDVSSRKALGKYSRMSKDIPRKDSAI